MPATLSDIARALGLSKMTVSRAINNHTSVRPDTRARVLAVAEKLHYQPHHYARALSTNRSHLLGIVVPDLVPSYFAELIRGIEAVARPAGFHILICNTDEDAARETADVGALRHRADGLIVASALGPARTALYKALIAQGVKMVLIDRPLDDVPCPAVTTDNVRVGAMATAHLIALGHRRVGHLYGDASIVAAERYRGYRQALARRGVRASRALVRPCGFLEEEGRAAMRAWIAEGGVPPAIFVSNDGAAIGAMRAIEEAGLRVPEDIALVGAGNIHYGDLLRVPLTTVSWDKQEMGQSAARLLIAAIEGTKRAPRRSARVIVKPQLLVRASCGAAATAASRAARPRIR
jgi:LacI family transcriptional regulator